jgi:hypothetical protein
MKDPLLGIRLASGILEDSLSEKLHFLRRFSKISFGETTLAMKIYKDPIRLHQRSSSGVITSAQATKDPQGSSSNKDPRRSSRVLFRAVNWWFCRHGQFRLRLLQKIHLRFFIRRFWKFLMRYWYRWRYRWFFFPTWSQHKKESPECLIWKQTSWVCIEKNQL